jgi:hypothetical protein
MTPRRLLLRLAIGAALLLAGTAAALAVREEVTEEALIAALRGGGNVIYMRHAQRAKGTHDTLTMESSWLDFADCSRQRNLTAAGRAEAHQLGVDLRQSGIRVDRVVALPLCRTRDTAILAFGNVVLERGMYDPTFVARSLAVTPAAGGNTMLVGSEFQLRQLTGFQLAPGEMAVFHPDGKGGAALLGRLKAADWLDD